MSTHLRLASWSLALLICGQCEVGSAKGFLATSSVGNSMMCRGLGLRCMAFELVEAARRVACSTVHLGWHPSAAHAQPTRTPERFYGLRLWGFWLVRLEGLAKISNHTPSEWFHGRPALCMPDQVGIPWAPRLEPQIEVLRFSCAIALIPFFSGGNEPGPPELATARSREHRRQHRCFLRRVSSPARAHQGHVPEVALPFGRGLGAGTGCACAPVVCGVFPCIVALVVGKRGRHHEPYLV